VPLTVAMEASTSPVVLLIPGIFGYGSFGPEDAPLLEYFAGVKQVLAPNLPANYVVLVHEPPPTGSLDERVASLHDAVWKLKNGIKLRHAEKAVTAERVHLVGHSTGGVDARLLANPKFDWVGGPRGRDRTDVIDAIGAIVALSAPFRGTPLVDSTHALRDAALAAVNDLTLLGTFRNSGLDAVYLRLLTGAAGVLRMSPLFRVPPSIVSVAARQAVRKRVSKKDADDLAEQIQSFLLKLHDDRQLYDDLSVANLEKINRAIDGGDRLARIHSYVTVSPKPPLIDIGFDLLGRIVYSTLYRRTARMALDEPQPVGGPLGPAAAIRELLKSDVSSDGAVPTRSQTLEGHARRIVLADHLDVVGSFAGGSGADVMHSDSNFTKDRFKALWADIASCIAATDRASDARDSPRGDGATVDV
jgi:triacylglycerol lipase